MLGTKLKIEGYAHVPMTIKPIEETEEEAAAPPPPHPQQSLPPEVLQALADTAHLSKAAEDVLADMPPPPPVADEQPAPPAEEAFAGAPPES